MKKFWDENKVLILGLASALLLALQQFAGAATVDPKVIGLALGMAAISYIAKNWRGQSATIIGILGNFGWALETVLDTGHFSVGQLIVQLTLVFGFSFMPDPKSRGYEHTDTIMQAKIDGEIDVPSALTSTEVKKEAKVQDALTK